jgi:hypothetical protein
MGIELGIIDDEHIHLAVISRDGMVLTIQKDTDLQPPNIDPDSDFGYIVVTGLGSKRIIENEDSVEFGKKLEKVLKNPLRKIQII